MIELLFGKLHAAELGIASRNGWSSMDVNNVRRIVVNILAQISPWELMQAGRF